jgi:murein L,D-transpeptidase YafK
MSSVIISLVLLAAISTPQQVTKIVVTKSDHTMTLYHDQTKLQSFRVSLGSHPGPKQQAGDRKTPEGLYVVDAKNSTSRFHHAFHLSYPNAQDRARAEKLRVNPGGDIEIHGQMESLAWLGPIARHFDWTAGCIALTNDEIDAIWPIVSVGTPVEIKP